MFYHKEHQVNTDKERHVDTSKERQEKSDQSYYQDTKYRRDGKTNQSLLPEQQMQLTNQALPFAKTKRGHVLNALPDLPDFRDKLYIPTLVDVPETRTLKEYISAKVPLLDQGQEGACTGFALATVVNYLLRTRKVEPRTVRASPDMLYALAKRYDEWSGENYDGSSARGAMKGWHKHGVCESVVWKKHTRLAPDVVSNAANQPLGAYFRVNQKDLVAMHSAISETGILYATASVHAGWDEPDEKGYIPYRRVKDGGHAFAIIGYDERGFWIQNSWGVDWGYKGSVCKGFCWCWIVGGSVGCGKRRPRQRSERQS